MWKLKQFKFLDENIREFLYDFGMGKNVFKQDTKH